MNERIIRMETSRDTYSAESAAEFSMTVGELMYELSHYPQDCKIVFSNDNGYTYGFINEDTIKDSYYD